MDGSVSCLASRDASLSKARQASRAAAEEHPLSIFLTSSPALARRSSGTGDRPVAVTRLYTGPSPPPHDSQTNINRAN